MDWCTFFIFLTVCVCNLMYTYSLFSSLSSKWNYDLNEILWINHQFNCLLVNLNNILGKSQTLNKYSIWSQCFNNDKKSIKKILTCFNSLIIRVNIYFQQYGSQNLLKCPLKCHLVTICSITTPHFPDPVNDKTGKQHHIHYIHVST